jgi:hypothetical protein
MLIPFRAINQILIKLINFHIIKLTIMNKGQLHLANFQDKLTSLKNF